MRYLIAIIALALLAQAVQGQVGNPTGKTYYVSVNGSDDNNGLSEEASFITIKKAADIVSAGDTVIIGDGEYIGRFEILRSGTVAQPIVFKAKNLHKATIVAPSTTRPGMKLVEVQAANIIIEGLKFDGKNKTDDGINIRKENVVIRNNIIFNQTHYGIGTWASGPRAKIIGNEIFNNGGGPDDEYTAHGLYVHDGSKDIQIIGNLIHDNCGRECAELEEGNAIHICCAPAENLEISGNIMWNHERGLDYIGNNAKVTNNIFFNTQHTGIIAAYGSLIAHNTIIVNTPWTTSSHTPIRLYGKDSIKTNEPWMAAYPITETKATQLLGNIIIGKTKTIHFADDTNIVSNNNVFYTTDGRNIVAIKGTELFDLNKWKQIGYDADSVFINPLFVDEANQKFFLQNSSPAIDAIESITGITGDLLGTNRPVGQKNDIGALVA